MAKKISRVHALTKLKLTAILVRIHGKRLKASCKSKLSVWQFPRQVLRTPI